MLHSKLKRYKLILSSNSPRRQYLMREAGFKFELRIPPEIREDYPADMKPTDIPLYLAQIKASALNGYLNVDEIVITADTVVVLNNRILGKPKNYSEAFDMLTSLSGSRHEVITGVCFKSKDKVHVFAANSEVWFRKLTKEEINFYITEFKPYDKAGAYGVQEWIGYIGVEKINGSFFNVMGLPIQMVYVELEKFLNQL